MKNVDTLCIYLYIGGDYLPAVDTFTYIDVASPATSAGTSISITSLWKQQEF